MASCTVNVDMETINKQKMQGLRLHFEAMIKTTIKLLTSQSIRQKVHYKIQTHLPQNGKGPDETHGKQPITDRVNK